MFIANNSFSNIRNEIKEALQEEFDKKYQENAISKESYAYFDCCYNQAVFRFLYDIYIKNSPRKTLWDYVINDLKLDEDAYKKYKRMHQKLEKNQMESWEQNGLKAKGYPCPSHKQNNKLMITEYQILQLEIMLKLIGGDFSDLDKEPEFGLDRILYKNVEGKTAKTKNYTNDECIYDFNLFNDAYKIIESKEKNNFLRCLQYYQLEIGHRFETFYKFYTAIKELNIDTGKNKFYSEAKKQIVNLHSTHQSGVLQNTLITDVDLMINEFKKSPYKLKEIIFENRLRNIIIANTLKNVLHQPHMLKYSKSNPYSNKINEIIRCEEAETFFKNYIGDGQHITKNKDFEKDIEIKYFRRIYG